MKHTRKIIASVVVLGAALGGYAVGQQDDRADGYRARSQREAENLIKMSDNPDLTKEFMASIAAINAQWADKGMTAQENALVSQILISKIGLMQVAQNQKVIEQNKEIIRLLNQKK